MVVPVEERMMLQDEFSEQVRRCFPVGVWRSLFLDRTGYAEFGSAVRCLLCIEIPTQGPLPRDGLVRALRRLAPPHGGVVDPCLDEFALVSFADPQSALKLAVGLQRLAPRARLRLGIATGRCQMVLGSAHGTDFLILLGKERARAEELTKRAAPATVQLAPEAYEQLQEEIGQGLGGCLVVAEFSEDVLTEVSLTLPPHQSADMSTFAGLGLT